MTDREQSVFEPGCYEALVEHSNDGIYLFEEGGRIEFVNKRVVEISGIPREEWLGSQISELSEFGVLTDEEVETILGGIESIRQGEIEESRLELSPDVPHELQHLELRLTALPDDAGNDRVIGFSRDITEQKERERKLKETNAVLSTLLEAFPVGVLAEDASRNVLAANDRLFELFEFPGRPEEIIGADCNQMADEVSDLFEDPDGFVSRINELVADREAVEEEELSLRDGRTLERGYRPIELPDGRGHLWTYRDITDLKERLEKIRDLQYRSQELIRADSPEMIATTAVEIARKTLELPLSGVHLVGDDPDVLEPIAVTDEIREYLGEAPRYDRTEPARTPDEFNWDVFEAGDPIVIDDIHRIDGIDELETPSRSGIIYPLGDHGLLITTSAEPSAFDETDRYLTELLATILTAALDRAERDAELREQKELLQAERDRLNEFASVVSHDLRNPLSVAEARLELASDECDSEHLDGIARAHARMDDLIDDLLTLAREGETVSDLESVDLARLTENCWGNVLTAQATLRTDIERRIRADESRLQQLLENLMRNAVEHGGDAVTVTVGELETGFYVEDDGPGIPEDQRDEVFDVGYSTTEGGTGFGLSIVKQVAQAHGWDVRVTDGSDGGARFEITGAEFIGA